METTAILNSWTIENKAWNEGWDIFHTGQQDACHNLWELQAVDEKQIFEDDHNAILFVVGKVEQDANSYHADALRFLLKESANEMDSVIRSAIGEERYNSLLTLIIQ